jgi:hypothetical protein
VKSVQGSGDFIWLRDTRARERTTQGVRVRVRGIGFVVRGWARVRALGSGKGRSCLGCLGVLFVTGNPLKLI